MAPVRTIVFACPHPAAKSVMAAAYFDQLASQRGLAALAAARDAIRSRVVRLVVECLDQEMQQ